MGIFNRFPWSEEHQLNLDWILRSLKDLLTRVKALEDSGGGGGGGTTDYLDLDNKPQINSVTLTGNKTTAQLGLPSLGNVLPNMDGAASAGISTTAARSDHVHPSDTNKATVVPMPGNNLLNPANITTGYYYKAVRDQDNREIVQLTANSSFYCAWIDVVSGQDYIFTGLSFNAYNGDADGYAIGIAAQANTSIPLVVADTTIKNSNYNNTDKNITRLYFSWKPATFPTSSFMVNKGHTLLPYEPYDPTAYKQLESGIYIDARYITPPITDSEVYTVDIEGGGDYTSFTAALVDLANNENEKIIYVKNGTYDVFEEIGGAAYAAEVEAARQQDPYYSWFDCSTVVPKNTKIIGIGDVILEFKPTSSEITTQVMDLLSPVNVIYDIYMENITIDCDNCRYGIHDDTGHLTGIVGTRHIYKNIRIIKANTDGGMAQAFGCGMQQNQYMEFERCWFKSTSIPISFHNKGTPADDYTDGTIIAISDCVFEPAQASNTAMRFGNVNGKQVEINVRVFSSCIGGKILIGNESATERPNAFNLMLSNCGNPTINVTSITNIYTPQVFNIYDAWQGGSY